jgi:lipopolysaccharide export LptBFGC system permease protein LptF
LDRPHPRGIIAATVTLQLYLLRRHLVSIGFALAGLGILVIPAITVPAVAKLGGAGLGAVVEYVPLVLIELVPYLVPIAFLLGIVATFGRLAADNEWTAIRMAGVHPLKVLLPGLAVAIAGMALTYTVLASISPEWRYRQAAFLRESQIDKLMALGNGKTQFSIGDVFVDANSRDDAGTFYEVLLGIPARMLTEQSADPSAGDERSAKAEEDEVIVISADAIRVRFAGQMMVELYLWNASALRDDWELRSENPQFIWPLNDLITMSTKRRDRSWFMTTPDIRRRLSGDVGADEKPLTDKQRDDLRYEVQFRMALSASYAVFLLLGAATGLWLKSGTQLGAMTGAIAVAFLYYVMSLELGQQLAKVGLVSPEVAAWSTDGVFLVLGAVMARRILWR